jgi:hypothetical protein
MYSTAVLFAHRRSIYKTIAECDVYDIDRDARSFQGGLPVVAHPPCAHYCRLRHFAHDTPENDPELAVWAVEQVERCGGILEHPKDSQLWARCNLPLPMERNSRPGYTLQIDQWWFGHPAKKATWLYVCGIDLDTLPEMPYKIGYPAFHWPNRGRVKELRKTQRSATPLDFALWLVAAAKQIQRL